MKISDTIICAKIFEVIARNFLISLIEQYFSLKGKPGGKRIALRGGSACRIILGKSFGAYKIECLLPKIY